MSRTRIARMPYANTKARGRRRNEISSTEEAPTRFAGAVDAIMRRRSATAGPGRAMCEASRGRQLRLIRAETDSGRNDGLLNALTCRQSLPPARNFTSSVHVARTASTTCTSYRSSAVFAHFAISRPPRRFSPFAFSRDKIPRA